MMSKTRSLPLLINVIMAFLTVASMVYAISVGGENARQNSELKEEKEAMGIIDSKVQLMDKEQSAFSSMVNTKLDTIIQVQSDQTKLLRDHLMRGISFSSGITGGN